MMNTNNIPLPLILAGLANTSIWLTTGVMQKNIYMLVSIKICVCVYPDIVKLILVYCKLNICLFICINRFRAGAACFW